MRTGSKTIVANAAFQSPDTASTRARAATAAAGPGGYAGPEFKRALKANESYSHTQAAEYHHKKMQLNKMAISAGPVFGAVDTDRDKSLHQQAELHRAARDAHEYAAHQHERVMAPSQVWTGKGEEGMLN